MKFIVDENAGKLARWLRRLGYDAVFFDGADDADMVRRALREGRVLLTRDTQVMKRGAVTSGRIRAVMVTSDDHREQMRQVVSALGLDCREGLLTVCLECNEPLQERTREEVREQVPPYVWQTQQQYRECPRCHRIYWRGTHWQNMMRELERFCPVDRHP
ncbi:MAG: Mut7-C RNAse domain-containing protein [Chloroflexota bacterium]